MTYKNYLHNVQKNYIFHQKAIIIFFFQSSLHKLKAMSKKNRQQKKYLLKRKFIIDNFIQSRQAVTYTQKRQEA